MAIAIKPVENRIHFLKGRRNASGESAGKRGDETFASAKLSAAGLRCFRAKHPLITAMVKLPAAAMQSVCSNPKTPPGQAR